MLGLTVYDEYFPLVAREHGVSQAAVLVSVGVLLDPWVGFCVIAAGFGLVHNAVIVTEARLQSLISGAARATVTSVAGLSTEVVALTGYAAFTLGASVASVSALVAASGLPMLVVAWATGRWLPNVIERPEGPSAPAR